MNLDINLKLLKDNFIKYRSSPSSRFTCYPKMKNWNNSLEEKKFLNLIEDDDSNTFDLYLHIPFCSSFCTFCCCNIKMSKNSDDEDKLLKSLEYEIEYYKDVLKNKKIRNLYLGGGTPTYFSTTKLNIILSKIFSLFSKDKLFNGWIETTPYNLSEKIITTLLKYEIKNFKVGLQDINKFVLNSINRSHQNQECIDKLFYMTQKFDLNLHIELVAGLPKQTPLDFERTLQFLLTKPVETITIYPLAHSSQNDKDIKFQQDLGFNPLTYDQKQEILISSNFCLIKNNFKPLGFDCFQAPKSKENYSERSIFGFTPSSSDLLIGVGPSAISKGKYFLKRNENIFNKYNYACSSNKNHKQSKNHLLTENDINNNMIINQLINDNFCNNINRLGNIPACFKINNKFNDLGKLFLSSLLEKIIR